MINIKYVQVLGEKYIGADIKLLTLFSDYTSLYYYLALLHVQKLMLFGLLDIRRLGWPITPGEFYIIASMLSA